MHLYVQSFDFACTGLAFTWVYYNNIATLYAYSWHLLKPTGIQYVTISMLGTTTNGEPETYRRQDNVLVCVQDTAFTVWSAASVSESESQPTERLSDVLPNQQGHQILYRTTCCVGCGDLSYFPLQYCTLSRWRYGEALRQDFLYTTKLESKFILRPTGMRPPRSIV